MKSLAVRLSIMLCILQALFVGDVTAQVDLSGNWVEESTQEQRIHGSGPFPGNFAGIPLNEQGRQGGFAYPGDQHEELYRQCEPWSVHYIVAGPWGGRFSALRDASGQLIAWRLSSPAYDRLPMTIWMDGRPHPSSQALHTYAGFTTGEWDGNTLVTFTTHLKDSYLERNGPPVSNQQTVRLFFTRHDAELMVLGVVRDAVYLEAPYALAQDFQLELTDSGDDVPLYCQPAEVVEGLSDGFHTATVLPDQIPAARTQMNRLYGIPLDATGGGAQTMYPEFRKHLRAEYHAPRTYCRQFCCSGRSAALVCARN
jgi:hypothetical protein